MHDPTKFPDIYFGKGKPQHNFRFSFRFKVSIHKVFRQQCIFNKIRFNAFYVIMKRVRIVTNFKQSTHQIFN